MPDKPKDAPRKGVGVRLPSRFSGDLSYNQMSNLDVGVQAINYDPLVLLPPEEGLAVLKAYKAAGYPQSLPESEAVVMGTGIVRLGSRTPEVAAIARILVLAAGSVDQWIKEASRLAGR